MERPGGARRRPGASGDRVGFASEDTRRRTVASLFAFFFAVCLRMIWAEISGPARVRSGLRTRPVFFFLDIGLHGAQLRRCLEKNNGGFSSPHVGYRLVVWLSSRGIGIASFPEDATRLVRNPLRIVIARDLRIFAQNLVDESRQILADEGSHRRVTPSISLFGHLHLTKRFFSYLPHPLPTGIRGGGGGGGSGDLDRGSGAAEQGQWRSLGTCLNVFFIIIRDGIFY